MIGGVRVGLILNFECSTASCKSSEIFFDLIFLFSPENK